MRPEFYTTGGRGDERIAGRGCNRAPEATIDATLEVTIDAAISSAG
jgi:hypothetical protein